MKVAVLVSGGGTNLQALLDAKAAGGLPAAEFCGVISSRPGAYALQRAQKAGVPTAVVCRKDYDGADAFDEALAARLAAFGAQCVVLAGYLSMIGPRVLAAYPNRILNVHPSLIPAFCGAGYYGLRVHQAALARGVKVTGATVHLVNGEYDAGPILLQKAVEVAPGDTPQTLQRRVMEQAEWVILPQALDLLTRGCLG